MLLPLAWLVRVEDTPEHRQWLETMARFVFDTLTPAGTIPQMVDRPYAANEQYGTGEAPIVYETGDPGTDLLYTMNFAFSGMHEAAAATGDPRYAEAAERMAEFLIRAQTQSEARPELSGTWFRAFDFQRWDYWGSDGDAGWGVWSTETGWTHSWITATLALRQMKTSLWEISQDRGVKPRFDELRRTMLPDAVLRESAVIQTDHAAQGGKPVQLADPYHYDEAYRPQFHFTYKKGWMSDINGLFYYDGEYHFFSQHNPAGPGLDYRNIHWGHAVSKDLIHWTELPPALAPDKDGPIFSGSAVVDWKNTSGLQTGTEPVIVAFYTAARYMLPDKADGVQSMAYSNDRGRTWTKYAGNPVLPAITHYNRDPKVLWHEPTGKWVMVITLSCADHWLRGQTATIGSRSSLHRT